MKGALDQLRKTREAQTDERRREAKRASKAGGERKALQRGNEIPPDHDAPPGRRVTKGEPVTGPIKPVTPTFLLCQCGESLPKPKRGPRPEYCSPACKQRAYRQRQA